MLTALGAFELVVVEEVWVTRKHLELLATEKCHAVLGDGTG